MVAGHDLGPWGWNDQWQKTWDALALGDAFCPGRIRSQREDVFHLITAKGPLLAESAGVLFHRCSQEERPAVGDWVAVDLSTEDGAVVTQVLPRRSRFLREAPGARGVAQIVATNVDTVLIVIPVADLNLNRLERFLVATCAGGADPTVILSKGDLVDPDLLEPMTEQVRALKEDLTVVCSANPLADAEKVRTQFAGLLEAGVTYALVGSSGAGKSTLINALAGADLQQTAEVREGDGKGRHVTSFRELFALPHGALMMDTPGMREFALWSDAGGLEQVFGELERLAARCRFSDCAHDGEPGCAVAQAVAERELTVRRLENWRALQAEMGENVARRTLAQGRRDRTDLRRKKKRDRRFSGR